MVVHRSYILFLLVFWFPVSFCFGFVSFIWVDQYFSSFGFSGRVNRDLPQSCGMVTVPVYDYYFLVLLCFVSWVLSCINFQKIFQVTQLLRRLYLERYALLSHFLKFQEDLILLFLPILFPPICRYASISPRCRFFFVFVRFWCKVNDFSRVCDCRPGVSFEIAMMLTSTF